MSLAFVTAYAKGSENILQHWLWKTLKDTTQHFGPLLKVFANNHGTTPSCVTTTSNHGTDAWTRNNNHATDSWTRIFTIYQLAGATITHKLVV